MAPVDQLALEQALQQTLVGDPLAPPTRQEICNLVRHVVVPMTTETALLVVEFAEHARNEKEWQSKVDVALFHPTDGLVNIKTWLVRIGAGVASVIVFAGVVGSLGRNLNWW